MSTGGSGGIQTRAQKKAAEANPEQPVPVQEDPVSVNWFLFDREHTTTPLVIQIPRQLFSGISQGCRRFLVDALREELDFIAQLASIKLYQPRQRLSIYTAQEDEWPATIINFNGAFEPILLAQPLATALAGKLDDKDIVHLIVTAKGAYLPLRQVEHLETEEEGRDVVGGLPENLRFVDVLSHKGASPSEGSKSTEYASAQGKPQEIIYDGRWARPDLSTVAPPIQMFNPIFESFVRDAKDSRVQPSIQDLIDIQELVHIASKITDESTRALELRRKLSTIVRHRIHQEPNADTSCADGLVTFDFEGVGLPVVIMEIKRELGEGGSDASTQAGLSMRRAWTQEYRAKFAKKCCCPTLILAGGGPWLAVLGGVFTDKFIVQRLTDMMWIGHSSTHEEDRVHRLARVLVAFRNSLRRLLHFYEEISTSNIPAFHVLHPHPRNYPYPTSFIDSESGETLRFKYVGTLENDPRCVTYKAKIQRPIDCRDIDSPRDIVVKFVARYGRDVHEFLARGNHAPRLRYFGPPLVGDEENILGDDGQPSIEVPNPPTHGQPSLALPLCPLKMVVMDYIARHPEPWPQNAREQIKNVLTKLHDRGYVFGDLRRPNVLFDKHNEVKFIDFDWSGSYDRAVTVQANTLPLDEIFRADDDYTRYPLNLSTNIEWAAGVGDLLPIRPEHDLGMLKKLAFGE